MLRAFSDFAKQRSRTLIVYGKVTVNWLMFNLHANTSEHNA